MCILISDLKENCNLMLKLDQNYFQIGGIWMLSAFENSVDQNQTAQIVQSDLRCSLSK